MPQHIVIVEDERISRMRIAAYLRQQGYRVSEAEDAPQMESIIAADPAELLIVDINLEGKDGLTITREQRAISKVGIILLTARDDQVDKIVGLEMGADDYVTKPYDKRELAARVKNLLRRTAAMRQMARRAVLQFGEFSFDIAGRQLCDGSGGVVPLTRAEFELLRVLVANPGVVMDRDRLLANITHRSDGTNQRTVDVLVRRLRRKLGDDPRAPRFLCTAHGEGYVFTAALG